MKQKKKPTYATALDKENVGRLVQYNAGKRWLTAKLLSETPSEEYQVQPLNSKTPLVVDRYTQQQHNIIRLVPPELQKPVVAKRARKTDPQKKQAKKPKYTQKQIAALQSRALQLYRADHSHAKELGYALLQVRAALKHGEFKQWWQKNNLSQARVSYCTRLVQGKVAEAKAKRKQSPFNGFLVKEVKSDMDKFLRICAPPNHPSVDEVYSHTIQFLGRLILDIGKMQEWKQESLEHPLVQLTNKRMSGALRGVFNALFAGKDSEHLITAGLVPELAQRHVTLPAKKPPQSEVEVPKRNAVESEAAEK